MKKGLPFTTLMIVVLGLLICGMYYFGFQSIVHVVPLGEKVIVTSTVNSLMLTSTSNGCGTDVEQLMMVPPLFPELQWTLMTSSTATGFSETAVSSSTGILTYLDPLTLMPDSSPRRHPLQGEEWNAPGSWSTQVVWSSFWNYYESQLKQDGWSPKIDISGYQIWGIDASGVDGGENGFIKIQSGNLRTIVLEYRTVNGQSYFNVFLSNIIPLSQIIPSYQLNCADSGTAVPIGGP